jgi:HK97 family phage prohead protease
MTMLTKCAGVALDLKAVGDDGTIEGYGSIFGNVDAYGEVVEPGAFADSLAAVAAGERTVKMLWQHDSWQPIGVWDELKEDRRGLKVKGRLLTDVSPKAAEAHGLIKAGAMEGLSIGYRVVDAGPHPKKPGVYQLRKLDLREVSPVTFPANEKATIEQVKHILAMGELPTPREFEKFLRDAGGFSKRLAAAIAAKATPHLRGDPDGQATDRLTRFLSALQP